VRLKLSSRRAILAPLILAAGIAAAFALSAPHAARAWDIEHLPGYSVLVVHLGTGCTGYQVSGYGAQAFFDACDPDFQTKVNAFVDATCSCVTTPTTTAATAPVTTQPATSSSTSTTSSTPAVTTTTTTTTPAEPPPPVTQTVVVQTSVTTTLIDPAVTQRLDAIEQRQQVDEARIAALEAHTGEILGEPKNESPFVSALDLTRRT
jgi:hypothetical protein